MPELFTSITQNGFTLGNYIICTAIALACGIIAAVAASYKNNVTKSFTVSLVLLPAIVETVIIMVNGNIGTGVAVMGAFSLIRFRSAAGRAKDIVSIFLVMTAGLSCAGGYVAIALLLTVIVSVLMIVIGAIPLKEDRTVEIHITVPESLNFNGVFDDIFKKYTVSNDLVSVKTTNMGSLFKLSYRAEMKNKTDIKSFIDELRMRNGNLEISVMEASRGGHEEL